MDVAIAEYRRLRSLAPLAAFAVVGRYLAASDAQSARTEAVARCRPHVRGEDAGRAMLQASESLARALRILSIGSRFEYEELMLVMTIRVEVALAQLAAAALDAETADVVTADLDAALEGVAQSDENRATYASALGRMRRVVPDGAVVNWPTPTTGQSGTTSRRSRRPPGDADR